MLIDLIAKVKVSHYQLSSVIYRKAKIIFIKEYWLPNVDKTLRYNILPLFLRISSSISQ